MKTELYVAETEEGPEGAAQSKLLLRLKKNKTEIVEQLGLALCEDTPASPPTHHRQEFSPLIGQHTIRLSSHWLERIYTIGRSSAIKS